MLRPFSKGKTFSASQWDDLVVKMQDSEWSFECEPLSFVVAKLFDVHPWQVGPLGYFHDRDDWLGAGYLGWTPIGRTEMSTQNLPDDCEVIVATKEGKEVARKKVEDFSFAELLEYSTSHFWILPEKEVDSLTSWKFSQAELERLQAELTKAPWGLTDQEEEALVNDPRFGTSLYRPRVGTLKVGKESLHYLGTTFVNIKPDPDNTHTISSDARFYILDCSTSFLIDSFRADQVTLDLVRKYARGFAWVEATPTYDDRIAAFDAEVAKNRKK